MKIRVNKIKVDLAVSVREENDEETIQRYMDVLEYLPPITVFRSDGGYLLADGFHRCAAASRRGWKEIEAEVREGGYEEACEYAVSANLKHGKPLTQREYETALKRLVDLHPELKQKELGEKLFRSRQWVEKVLAADRVEEFVPDTGKLDTSIKAEIARAPKRLWRDLSRAVEEQEWTQRETQEKVKEIKEDQSRAQEILHPPEILIPILEAPADKLMPLNKEIDKLCKMHDEFCNRLDPSLYDWGRGLLAYQTLRGLYVLAEKTGKLAKKTRRMIKFLEGIE